MKIKKIAALVLAAGSILNVLPTFAQETNVYEIRTKEELFALKEIESVDSVRLCADLDLSGMEAEPYLIKTLTGTFDGGGHTISNLTLTGQSGNWSTKYSSGLIGTLTGTITNLKLENVTLQMSSCGFSYIGTLAGIIPDGNTALIKQCDVEGELSVSSGSQLYLGGLVGGISGSINQPSTLTIQDCASSVSISGSSSGYSGGITGYLGYYSTLDLSGCAILGNLSNGTVCGIAGYAPSKDAQMHLSDSYFAGVLGGSGRYKRVITHNLSELSSLTCQNLYYDKDQNLYVDTLSKGYSTVTGISGLSTQALLTAAAALDGFEIREGEFGGYPVPKRTKATPAWDLKFSGDNAVVTAAAPGTYYVIFAAYREKRLTDTAWIKQEFSAGETTVSAPSSFIPEGADSVRIMLFDSLESLHPLTSAQLK